MAEQATFTGRSRERRTRWRVWLSDRIAAAVITVGGIGTIVAVSGVCLYLLWTVLPLFGSASLGEPTKTTAAPFTESPTLMRVAESDAIGWAVSEMGELVVFQPREGEVLHRQTLSPASSKPTAFAADSASDAFAIGFDDGTVRLGTIAFETTFLDPAGQKSKEFEQLAPAAVAASDDGVVVRTPQNQLREESVAVEISEESIDVSPGSAVQRLDRLDTDDGSVLLAWSDGEGAHVVTIDRFEDLFTGQIRIEPGTKEALPLPEDLDDRPLFVGLTARAAEAILVWPDGTAVRFDIRDPTSPRLIERTDIATDGRALTAVKFAAGRLTLIAGDAEGKVTAWFPARLSADENVGSASSDTQLVRGHELERGPAAVATLAPSSRSREVAVAYSDGTLRLFQVTTEELLVEGRIPIDGNTAGAIRLDMLPGEEQTTLYAAVGQGLYRAHLDLGYPEAGWKTYFRPIWYESYSRPRHVWQSSAGTSAAEPKLGLVPLVFGTLKATFYSMLFGVPLAMLAAIYTSEFLSKQARSRVKPVIEMMASLPSVVLGFLAAIVFAPIVGEWLPAVIAAGATVPLSLFGWARVWQLLPKVGQPRWDRWRLPLAALAIAFGFVLAGLLGPVLERFLFAGDITRWLDGQIGTGFGAWLMLLLPLSAIGVTAAVGRWVHPRLLSIGGSWSRGSFALADLAKFILMTLVAVALASMLSGLLTLAGLDPRGTFVSTYVQRNALVVGFVMGFAIIPLIYTLADDALNAVPEALRSASLGAGATQWQTALRVVIPAATSGLFSAVMVGLGRAVGETMIVLMAAGNTPIMEINIFNGFQTLSAAIATEMPEAVRGSTHFRTLFLAALVLFSMTFVVNTVAEIVRLRFRKRVVQL